MRLKKNNNLFYILSLITHLTLLTSCNTALLNPKGQIAIEQRSLILTAFSLMMIVVIPAVLMSIIFAWKYRAKNTKEKYSPNWSHSNKIEVVVWVIPIFIIIFLGTLTWKSTHKLDPSKPIISSLKPVVIQVVSLDWKWLFIYPDFKIATVNQIVFPVNHPVIFKITSNTVMNAFFIPSLGSQVYAMPGMLSTLNLVANEIGIFNGISSNFSGIGFSGMKFKAIATSNEATFTKWVNTVKKSPYFLTTGSFNKLAIPSHNNSVKFFSNVKTGLFQEIINQFNMHSKNSIKSVIDKKSYEHINISTIDQETQQRNN